MELLTCFAVGLFYTSYELVNLYCNRANILMRSICGGIQPYMLIYSFDNLSCHSCMVSLPSIHSIIAGIRVQSLKESQITMDIDLRWGGDPNIILAVEAGHIASIPIQVG